MIAVLQTIKKVFCKPSYIALMLTASISVFIFAVWFPNISLIVKIMSHSEISLRQKLNFPISLLGGIITNFTLFSALYTVAIAVLFGIDLAMVVYLLRRRIDNAKKNGIAAGLLGIISGVIGIGCAVCGSFLLTSVLSLLGAAGILSFLPFGGGEFGILGVVLLSVSIYTAVKQIQNPAICKVKF